MHIFDEFASPVLVMAASISIKFEHVLSVQEKRDRAKAALKVNESIARERIDLVNQLDELREQNKSLKVRTKS